MLLFASISYLRGPGLFTSSLSWQMSQVCHSTNEFDRPIISASKQHDLWDFGFTTTDSIIWAYDIVYSRSTSPTVGTRLTGHLYSTRLNTTIVRQQIPLASRDARVKVLLVSPFTTDKSAATRAKLASMKCDYTIQPEMIKQTLQFWHDVDDKIMEKI